MALITGESAHSPLTPLFTGQPTWPANISGAYGTGEKGQIGDAIRAEVYFCQPAYDDRYWEAITAGGFGPALRRLGRAGDPALQQTLSRALGRLLQ